MAEGGHGTATKQCESVSSITTTVLEDPAPSEQARSPNLVLKLKKTSSDKKVKWDQGTVDNEHMNKKKSKCCCVYEKPRLFGESSSEDDDDDHECTNHCRSHKKKDYQRPPQPDPDQPNDTSST